MSGCSTTCSSNGSGTWTSRTAVRCHELHQERDQLLAHEVTARFFAAVLAQAKAAQPISAEHFTVDGTLLESWASLKSFQPRGGSGGGRNAEVEFAVRGARNDTHVSTTDPDALIPFDKYPLPGLGRSS